MKRYRVVYTEPFKDDELTCTIYAFTELMARTLFAISFAFCTIISIKEDE